MHFIPAPSKLIHVCLTPRLQQSPTRYKAGLAVLLHFPALAAIMPISTAVRQLVVQARAYHCLPAPSCMCPPQSSTLLSWVFTLNIPLLPESPQVWTRISFFCPETRQTPGLGLKGRLCHERIIGQCSSAHIP